MPSSLTPGQLTGLDESHLVTRPDGHRLQPEASEAFSALQSDAEAAGFELAIASSFRSFERQLAIWNGKASGERPVFDDRDHPLKMAELSYAEQLHAILRYSAIPGTSRHHWGTDLDVYDARAVPVDYRVQLTQQEVSEGGPFDRLHCWLDSRMAAGESHGFFRPYGCDRGGVAPERWHLSYAPLSTGCESEVNAALLKACWDGAEQILLRGEIDDGLEDILSRYVNVPGDWCQSPGQG